jgi:hypothetical protein
MIALGTYAAGKSGRADRRITIKAVTDGAVWIDGQYTYDPMRLDRNQYWTIEGINVSNSRRTVVELFPGSHNNIIKRVCAWNANPNAPGINEHVWLIWNSSANLFEDICGFGFGRNILSDYGGLSRRNVFRRVWLRWEGWPPRFTSLGCWEAPGPAIQFAYGTSGDTLIENILTVYHPYLQSRFPQRVTCGQVFGAGGLRDPVPTPYRIFGAISYGYDSPYLALTHSWFNYQDAGANIVDYFLDARSQGQVWPFVLSCRLGSEICGTNSADRITSIRGATTSNLYRWKLTNFHECVSLGNCPDFYTGSGTPGGTSGSRACSRYQGGTLTTTPLWPWPMDDRIKAALARTGSPPLAGADGMGYAANTVTSEIVSRYGSIPIQCRT